MQIIHFGAPRVVREDRHKPPVTADLARLSPYANVDLDAAMARRLRVGAVVIPGRRTAGRDPGDERAQLGPVRSDPGSGRLIG